MLFATEIPPMVIGTPKLWVDALRTPLGAVASWTDLSGYGNHPTQGTGAQQPINTANQQGGKPTLLFTGTNSSSLTLPSGLFLVPNGNNTVFAVAKRNTESGAAVKVVEITKAGAQRLELGYNSASGGVGYQSRAGVGSGVSSTGNTNTNYQILTGFRSGTTQSVQVNNGTAVTNTSGANESTCDGGNIGSLAGATNFLTGGIAEIIIYPYAVSAAGITYLNRYLANKWGIAIS